MGETLIQSLQMVEVIVKVGFFDVTGRSQIGGNHEQEKWKWENKKNRHCIYAL